MDSCHHMALSYLSWPTLYDVSFPRLYWAPHCLMLPLKCPVTPAQTEVQLISPLTPFPIAVVHYWLRLALTTLTVVWLCRWQHEEDENCKEHGKEMIWGRHLLFLTSHCIGVSVCSAHTPRTGLGLSFSRRLGAEGHCVHLFSNFWFLKVMWNA